MSRVGSTPITKQPTNYEIYNTFGVMGNEIIVHEWTFEEKKCGCTTNSYNTFTDARLVIRTETTNCCHQQNHNDVSIFLRDIAELRQSTKFRDNCSFCKCCIRCCRSPKIIEIRGTFGSKILYIPNDDMDRLQIEIPAAAGNHKLISHH
jgi:hypothetical protein